MTKEEIKSYLLEKGASNDLLLKPAVFERILACFDANSYYGVITGNFYEIVKPLSQVLSVDENGNITINDGVNSRVFKRMPNNQALYINNDESGFSIDEQGEYLIDKYGMDIKFTDINGETIERKENGKIGADEFEFLDNGSPIINTYDLLNSKDDKAWIRNRKEVVKRYPTALQWFIKREKMMPNRAETSNKNVNGKVKELNERINKLVEENKKLKEEISNLKRNTVPKEELDTLKIEKRKTEIERNILKIQKQEAGEKNEKLTKKNQEQLSQNDQLMMEKQQLEQDILNLKTRNQNLQKMLQQTLAFCKMVQSSLLGKFFFGRKLKQLPSSSEDIK